VDAPTTTLQKRWPGGKGDEYAPAEHSAHAAAPAAEYLPAAQLVQLDDEVAAGAASPKVPALHLTQLLEPVPG
jgi:hypothetical protein